MSQSDMYEFLKKNSPKKFSMAQVNRLTNSNVGICLKKISHFKNIDWVFHKGSRYYWYEDQNITNQNDPKSTRTSNRSER